MPQVSAVLDRLRSARRSPVPPVTSVGSGHLVEAAAVLLRTPVAGRAAEQRRAPSAAGWVPAGGVALPLLAGQPGPSTWFG